MSVLVPTIIEKSHEGERAYDIYSRLLKDRIVFVGGEIEDTLANSIIAQLLFLDKEDSSKPINMYINSVGGSISSGMAIFDTMNHIGAAVSTIAVGIAASMGAFLLAAGEKNNRFALKNAEVLIHQPLASGISGQASDIEIDAKHILYTKKKLVKYLAEFTGQTEKRIELDADRDYWMTADEAKKYGIIDKVVN